MNDVIINGIVNDLGIKKDSVIATLKLLGEGATIPFIARYRKELTGTMDEVNIATIRDYIDKFIELDKRKEAILKSLEERELLTPELKEDIDNASDMLTLEDI